MSPRRRFAAHGIVGIATEFAFTGLRGRPRTSLWMLPVYGLAQPLFEPAHDCLRQRPPWLRAACYLPLWGAFGLALEQIDDRLRGFPLS